MNARADDDRFHPPPSPDPSWAETCWFAFAAPERKLGGTLYPLFRSGLGVCALGVAVWDASAHEPWRARYARRLWHVPIPDGDLDDFEIEGLRIRVVEPLQRYRVAYADGDRLGVDLTYQAVIPAHAPLVTPERGHLDQPCHVRGTLTLDGEVIPIDAYEMHDRSWGPRDDLRRTRASYCYGIAGGEDSFLAMTFAGDERDESERVIAGFLVREGHKENLVSGTREVLARDPRGFPTRVCLQAADAAGRGLSAEGECLSRLAEQATPGMFAWMSLTRWSHDVGTCFGQDQEIWSPDTWPLP